MNHFVCVNCKTRFSIRFGAPVRCPNCHQQYAVKVGESVVDLVTVPQPAPLLHVDPHPERMPVSLPPVIALPALSFTHQLARMEVISIGS